MTKAQQKQIRLEHANALIQIISQHGRKFFRTNRHSAAGVAGTDRVAQLILRNGHVYLIDECSGKAVYTHKTGFSNDWRGFTHGGTLRSLVEDMRDYITKGIPVPRWKIVIQQLGYDTLEKNIWGYDLASAIAVREAAYQLPIVAKE